MSGMVGAIYFWEDVVSLSLLLHSYQVWESENRDISGACAEFFDHAPFCDIQVVDHTWRSAIRSCLPWQHHVAVGMQLTVDWTEVWPFLHGAAARLISQATSDSRSGSKLWVSVLMFCWSRYCGMQVSKIDHPWQSYWCGSQQSSFYIWW